jgi:DNA polymerase-3 subunit alpha
MKFKCGCEIPIVNGVPKIDFEALNLDCPKTWKIYGDGYTQSIFQLEKYLGKRFAKELKPESIEDAAALIAVIRPGTLQAQDENGKSLTQIFCDRKNNGWISKNTTLDILLEDTYSINIYQEQSMIIARDIAGFSGPQCMKLIKGIGKKDANLLLGLRKEFLDGCSSVGRVTDEEANSIFDNIEASARYAFNKCASPDTLVQTLRGPSRLDDIVIGDLVNSPDGFIEVTDKFECGQKEVVEIELENGKTIICTLDHKFLCGDRKVRELREIINLNLDIVCDE